MQTPRILRFAFLCGLLGLLISGPIPDGGFAVTDLDVAYPFLFFFVVGLILGVLDRLKRS